MALQIQPKRGLGAFVLGSSIYEIIKHLKSNTTSFPSISLTYSPTSPLSSNVILTLAENGIRLRFDGAEQRLRLIEVLDYKKCRLVYNSHELCRNEGRPTFKSIYNKIFGPTFSGESLPEQGLYVLSYPGVAFSFPIADWVGEVNTDTFLRAHVQLPSTSMAIYDGETWAEARGTLFISSFSNPRANMPQANASRQTGSTDDVEMVKVFGDGKVEFIKRQGSSFILTLQKTNPQDVVVELGPPDAIYRKNDHRLSIHKTRQSAGARVEETSEDLTDEMDSDDDSSDGVPGTDAFKNNLDYFYNYFGLGFDLFFSTNTARQAVATKVILHGNVPGSFEFHRYRRARWVVNTPSLNFNSEMPFPDIQSRLQDVFGKTEKPMLLNRGSDSPSSSCEMLLGWDESDGRGLGDGKAGTEEDAFANTELYGYPGFVFEVLRNGAISSLQVTS